MPYMWLRAQGVNDFTCKERWRMFWRASEAVNGVKVSADSCPSVRLKGDRPHATAHMIMTSLLTTLLWLMHVC